MFEKREPERTLHEQHVIVRLYQGPGSLSCRKLDLGVIKESKQGFDRTTGFSSLIELQSSATNSQTNIETV